MCTLTIVSHQNEVLVACNRDESRLRPTALVPRLRHFADRTALLPVDPVSDGTWIAASDAGVVLVLMNVYPTAKELAEAKIPQRTEPAVSRGRIIPHLLASADLAAAVAAAGAMDLARFESFRVVMIDRRHVVDFSWAAGRVRASEPESIERPMFFTSSGLGDDVVANPRRRLFDEFFAAGKDWPASQEAFHRHVWPDNPRVSVWMTRSEAMTVSRTVVRLSGQKVSMRYQARIGDSADVEETGPIDLPLSQVRSHAGP